MGRVLSAFPSTSVHLSKMMASIRMVLVSHLLLFLIPLLGLAVAGQEAVELFNLHAPSSSIAVSVEEDHLPVVSSSVILAERWLRNHVLSRYPSTNITAIIVGKDVVCGSRNERQFGLVLPSLKNLHYSLVRWGLVREIKVSVVFSHDCLTPSSSSSSTFRGDLAEIYLKPLLHFLQDYDNSIYTVNAHPLTPHESALADLGFSNLKMAVLKEAEKPIRERKLISSFLSSPYPEKPKPTNFNSPTPVQPPSSAADYASPPDPFFSFIPSASPSEIPTTPPDVFAYPPSPCPALPDVSPVPAAAGEEKQGLWCVAKPAVPAETLQKAIDYACGDGGADCDEIAPNGSCYFPDNVVAHASFAFNSYWQKTKRNGGSCGFEGTAILIDSDPSFRKCKFELS